MLLTGFSRTLTCRPKALAKNEGSRKRSLHPTKPQVYLPFPPGCKFLELFHVYRRLLAAQRLLGVFWLRTNTREDENPLAETHLQKQNCLKPLTLNLNLFQLEFLFGVNLNTHRHIHLNPGMVEAVLNRHPPPADIKIQGSFKSESCVLSFIKQNKYARPVQCGKTFK